MTKFEQAIANTRSVMGELSEDAVKSVVAIAEQSVFTATEAANALYFLGSAGLNAKAALQALNPVLQLATATQSDLAFSAEMIVGRLGQFNLEAEEAGRVANVMASGIANSQLTLQRLADFMPFAGTIAARFNLTIEQTIAG